MNNLLPCPCGASCAGSPYQIAAKLYRLDCERAECGWCVIAPAQWACLADWNTRAAQPQAVGEMESSLLGEMSRRFELNKQDDHWLCVDDTQLGVEFAFRFLKPHVNAMAARIAYFAHKYREEIGRRLDDKVKAESSIKELEAQLAKGSEGLPQAWSFDEISGPFEDDDGEWLPRDECQAAFAVVRAENERLTELADEAGRVGMKAVDERDALRTELNEAYVVMRRASNCQSRIEAVCRIDAFLAKHGGQS